MRGAGSAELREILERVTLHAREMTAR